VYQSRKDKGFMLLEVMIENTDYETPTVDELGSWADNYGLTMPVLSDDGESVLYSYATGSIGLPFTVLLDRGVVVDEVNSSEGSIDGLLDE